MTQIRVEPETLRIAAQKLAEAADRMKALAQEALQAGSGAESYEGQFGPQVHQMAEEVSLPITVQAQRLGELSEHLFHIADSFQDADEATQEGLAGLGRQLLELLSQAAPFLAPLSELLGPPESVRPSYSPQAQTSALANNAQSTGANVPSLLAPTPPLTPTPTSTPDAPLTAEPPQPPVLATPSLIATVMPSPTPAHTPTAYQLQRLYGVPLSAEERWEQEFTGELEACFDSGGSEECIEGLGFMVYEHYEINIYEVATARLDNPLPSDSFGFRMLAPNAAMNWMDERNPAFLEVLRMEWGHHTNYEPAFLNMLKQLHWLEYDQALDLVQEHEEFTRYFNEVGFEQIFGSGYEYRPNPLE